MHILGGHRLKNSIFPGPRKSCNMKQMSATFLTHRGACFWPLYSISNRIMTATTGRLQLVLNAAARVVSNTCKFDQGLHNLMHIDLHWLDVPERVTYKFIVMVYNCLHGTAPKYLSELCTLVADVASRRQLRSASQNVLLVPRYKLSGVGRRAFRVAGPLVWNSITDCMIRHLNLPVLNAS